HSAVGFVGNGTASARVPGCGITWTIVSRICQANASVNLALINYGDKLLTPRLNQGDIAKILLTFLVPYGVSAVSSVLAVRELQAPYRENG
ncbi:MAG: hypothetical protein ACR2QH_04725, partial [Geminicoccaceae bacterium]